MGTSRQGKDGGIARGGPDPFNILFTFCPDLPTFGTILKSHEKNEGWLLAVPLLTRLSNRKIRALTFPPRHLIFLPSHSGFLELLNLWAIIMSAFGSRPKNRRRQRGPRGPRSLQVSRAVSGPGTD